MATGARGESESEVAQSCPTLCDPVDCSLPGSSVHGIFLARVLEWVAISLSNNCGGGADVCPMADSPHLPPQTINEQQLL